MKRKIGNSWGVGGLYMTPLEQKFRGGGGSNRKNHPWEGYGYFLESHIKHKQVKLSDSELQKRMMETRLRQNLYQNKVV